MAKVSCREPGCAETIWEHRNKTGYCRPHRSTHGLAGHGTGNTRGVQFKDEVSYYGMHYRVKSVNGPASGFSCSRCVEQACDWAFVGDPGSARYGDIKQYTDKAQFGVWGTDVADYLPMCRSCHRSYDAAMRDTTAYAMMKLRWSAEQAGESLLEILGI